MRWDIVDCADAEDEDIPRICDVTGEISRELAASVHDGDPGGEVSSASLGQHF